jgi:hypothetical protein
LSAAGVRAITCERGIFMSIDLLKTFTYLAVHLTVAFTVG